MVQDGCTPGYGYDLADLRTRLTTPDRFLLGYDHAADNQAAAIREFCLLPWS